MGEPADRIPPAPYLNLSEWLARVEPGVQLRVVPRPNYYLHLGLLAALCCGAVLVVIWLAGDVPLAIRVGMTAMGVVVITAFSIGFASKHAQTLHAEPYLIVDAQGFRLANGRLIARHDFLELEIARRWESQGDTLKVSYLVVRDREGGEIEVLGSAHHRGIVLLKEQIEEFIGSGVAAWSTA